MLLDKIKSFSLSLLLGSMSAIVFAFAGLKLISARRGILVNHAANFAWQNSIGNWPLDLRLAIVTALVCGLIITALLFWLLYNTKWTFWPRRIDGEEEIASLLSKGTKTIPHIFAGKFSGKPFYVSTEDRALVIGPPGTGKTVFLLNQILKAARDGLSFCAVDIKPELHLILDFSLKEKGYRVIRINPAVVDEEADHWNPLEDVNDETALMEMCAALLPINDPRDAPFTESQRDWLKAAVFHIKAQPGGSLPGAFNFFSSSFLASIFLAFSFN